MSLSLSLPLMIAVYRRFTPQMVTASALFSCILLSQPLRAQDVPAAPMPQTTPVPAQPQPIRLASIAAA